MNKEIQRRKKEKIVADVLEQNRKRLFKKTVYKSFLKDLRPFIIVNSQKMPGEIVSALEKEYCLVYRGRKA